MSRRIEIELTSRRDDGAYTWRATGAREPKGAIDAALVPAGDGVGAVLKVEIDVHIDGIDIVQVFPSKAPRTEPERIEIVGSRRGEEPLVTAQMRAGRDRDRRPRARRDEGERRPDDRRPRGERPDRGERPERGERGDRARAGRPGPRDRDAAPRGERPRGPRPERKPAAPPTPPRPKPKRLKPGRAHRDAALASLAPEQVPIAEQVLRGGLQGVRAAVQAQNEELKAQGQPTISAGPLVAMAEELLPRLRGAEWLDRAEAAVMHLEDLSLTDLRSVVAAADDVVRDDAARALAASLRDGLAKRVARARQEWLDDLRAALKDGRSVRALRISARSPDPAEPLPDDLAKELTAAATAALAPGTLPDRWAVVLEALAYSPVRRAVDVESVPEPLPNELLGTVRKFAGRLPHIAKRFGVEPTVPPRPPRGGARPARKPAGGAPVPPPPRRAPSAALHKTAAEPETAAVPETAAETAVAAAPEPPAEPDARPAVAESDHGETPPAG